MPDTAVFRSGWAKKLLGWFILLGGGAGLLAMLGAVAKHWDTQTTADLLSGLFIGAFLVAFMLGGLLILSLRWSIEGNSVVSRHVFGTKTIPLSGLAGFGEIITVVGVVSIGHVELYDDGLKPVARLSTGIKDMPTAEAQLGKHLRYVIDEGSPAFPKRRFADAPNG